MCSFSKIKGGEQGWRKNDWKYVFLFGREIFDKLARVLNRVN